MSKTHKTKPFWVKMRQGHLATSIDHDHSSGGCDLPEEIGKDWWVGKRGCNYNFFYTGTHVCCCSSCHGSGGWDVRPGKRQRLEGRAAERNWDVEYYADFDGYELDRAMSDYYADLEEENQYLLSSVG